MHKFTDIKISDIKRKLCQLLKVPQNDCYFAAVNFKSNGYIIDDISNADKLVQARENMNRLKLFLCQFNEHEKIVIQRKDCFPVYFKLEWDIYDQH